MDASSASLAELLSLKAASAFSRSWEAASLCAAASCATSSFSAASLPSSAAVASVATISASIEAILFPSTSLREPNTVSSKPFRSSGFFMSTAGTAPRRVASAPSLAMSLISLSATFLASFGFDHSPLTSIFRAPSSMVLHLALWLVRASCSLVLAFCFDLMAFTSASAALTGSSNSVNLSFFATTALSASSNSEVVTCSCAAKPSRSAAFLSTECLHSVTLAVSLSEIPAKTSWM
mmetsp:Transcript_55870/g.158638  ORF Transcript_55870/g.158638 Transcript_55870/m.158638 type:complete len:236 (-) Transcript_55870:303-1010(-)